MSLIDSKASAAFEAAQDLIAKTAATAVVEATSNLLALMRTAPTYHERGQLAAVQTHLMQSRDALLAAFALSLRAKVGAELDAKAEERGVRDPTDWRAVSLVDEGQIEERLSFERIGQFISHDCEAELRELSAYTSAMLHHGWTDPERNPLRGNVIGSALQMAIEKVTDDAALQKMLAKELGQQLARALPSGYRAIIDDLNARGFRQADLTVRPAVQSAAPAGPAFPLEEARKLWERSMLGRPLADAVDTARDWERSMVGRLGADAGDTVRNWESSLLGRHAGGDALVNEADPQSSAGLLDRLMRGNVPGSSSRRMPLTRNPAPPEADARLMSLLRRLNDGTMQVASSADSDVAPLTENVIRAHRQELMQVSQGRLDHLLIEVVSSLFDQILADTRLAPQMAHQIARLQLPVLRVALRDPSFFSSRRHPVRRFINRVSALGSGVDDFASGTGKELLVRVGQLVSEIIAGDFDQLELYEGKLLELEKFAAEQAQAEVKASPAAETLQTKEFEWRQQHRFSLRLLAALEPMPLPVYLKEFLSQVWGQIILTVSQRDGAESTSAGQYRRTAADLVVSILPQRSPEQRKHFLATLPRLMSTLNEGMALIDWPAPSRDDFLGKLIAQHAGSLKAAPGSDLDYNLLLRQIEAAFRTPVPALDEPDEEASAPLAPKVITVIEQRFTPEEAQRVGLIGETAVDWSNKVETTRPGDLDLDIGGAVQAAAAVPAASAEPTPQASDLPALEGTIRAPEVVPAEAPEPTEGPQLRDHLQIGISYQLQLKDHWEKVRLSYMSPARSLFLFTYGSKDRRTISMTARMLERLCETRRMRSFEMATLIDRATQRARQQLTALKPTLH